MKQYTFLYSIACVLLALSCTQQDAGSVTEETPIVETPAAIDINDVKTVLPQAGNVDLVEMHCVPCHSLRYIEMQPSLSYKAWEKIVDKMINAYGAPIRDSVVRKDIINYLYAIKGTDEH